MPSRRQIVRLLAIAVAVLGGGSGQASSVALHGGENCAGPVAITSLPFSHGGDTTTATNEMIFLSETCRGEGAGARPGRDHIYSITVSAGNSLTFQLTPAAGYDATIYILGTCGAGSTCSYESDMGAEGQAETIGPVTLATGTHYVYIDSIFSEDDKEGFGTYDLSVTGSLGTPNNASFYTVTPCRVLDTRENGPALSAGVPRTLAVTGQCQIPPGAKSISANVTVTQPTAAGHLVVYPGGSPVPAVSTINFRFGQTRANNAIVPLAADGTVSAVSGQPGGNTVHFILDVNGYFQ